MIKKKALMLTIFSVLVSLLVMPAMAAPEISAKSAVLIEAESGEILYEKNADAQMLIASTTKIMTALVVLDHCDCDDTVEIKAEQAAVEGSSMYLRAGEKLTVRELLYGLLLSSGNDAASVLAYHTAGSIEEFADWMNQKAAEIGATSSGFKNPHGLDAEGHHSTAKDMAKIAAAAMKNKTFAEIVSTKNITIGNRSLTNHNKLLWNYDGALGIKTGYTKSAGRTLVSCAERNGLRLICVTLNDPDDWNDHASLYDWGFENCRRENIVNRTSDYCTLPVISGEKAIVGVRAAEDFSVLLKNADDSVEVLPELPEFVYADVTEGDVAGKLVIKLNGEEIKTVDLVYSESIAKDEKIKLSLWEQIKRGWLIAVKNGMSKIGYYGG